MEGRTPHERPVVTLDSNCLISYRYGQHGAPQIGELIALNRQGVIAIVVAVASALEASSSDPLKPPIRDWQPWLQEQGLEASGIFIHPSNIAFRTADAPEAITYDHQREIALRDAIHRVLFPQDRAMRWRDFLDRARDDTGISGRKATALMEIDTQRLMGNPSPSPIYPHGRPTPALDAMNESERAEIQMTYGRIYKKWLNHACDVEILFIHISRALQCLHPEWAVLVTRDGDDILKPEKVERIRRLGYPGQILEPTSAVAFLRSVMGT